MSKRTWIYDGAEFSHHGRDFRVNLPDDEFHGMPWENDEGRGIVERVRYPSLAQIRKAPGDVILETDRGTAWILKGAETRQKIRDQQWGLSADDKAALAKRIGREPTRREVEAECFAREAEFLGGFLRGHWGYVGVVVTDLESGASDSLWGIESCCKEYLQETAEELASGLHPLAEREEAACLEMTTD